MSNNADPVIYRSFENLRGSLTPEKVLELVTPFIAEENLYLSTKNSAIKILYPPILQENAAADHRGLAGYDRL